MTDFQTSALNGDINAVQQAINDGVDINSPLSGINDTALHGAAKNGHLIIIKNLLAAGADVYARNHLGQTPLDCVDEAQFPTSAKLLRRKQEAVS